MRWSFLTETSGMILICVVCDRFACARQVFEGPNVDDTYSSGGHAHRPASSQTPLTADPPWAQQQEGRPAPTSHRMWPVAFPRGRDLPRRPSPINRINGSESDGESQVVGTSLIIVDPRDTLPRGFCRAADGESPLFVDPRDNLPRGFCRADPGAGTDPTKAGGDQTTTWQRAADDRPTEAGDRSARAEEGCATAGSPHKIDQQNDEQGRSAPLSCKIWPAPYPGGFGHMQRYPLSRGPAPETLLVLVRCGSFSRHWQASYGSATPGKLRERHWDSSHCGCAVPSPKSLISASLI